VAIDKTITRKFCYHMRKRITIWSESELITYIDIYNLDSVRPSWQ
jgi:hypothetical protein